MTALLELAERCEKAIWPDRELDAAIGYAVAPEKASIHYRPVYTASIDAAMTLVPEDFILGNLRQRTRYELADALQNSVDEREHREWTAYIHPQTNERTFRIGPRHFHHGDAATPALALCAAALRARTAPSEPQS